MRYIFLIPVLFVFACSPTEVQLEYKEFTYRRDLGNESIQKILEFRDHRHADSLLQFVNDDDPLMRYELSLAIASVQDKSLGEALLNKVTQTNYPEVRKAMYYAIGQSCDEESAETLLTLLKSEGDSAAQVFLTEAIGKIGSGGNLVRLVAMRQIVQPYGMANAIYRFSQRNIYSVESVDQMVAFLDGYPAEVRLVASNMLARLKGEELIIYSEQLLKSLEHDILPEVRMNIASAFNKLNGNLYKDALLRMALDRNEHFGVRVNAINSLNYYHYESVAPRIVDLLNDDESKVQLEAAQFFINRTKRDEWTKIANMRDSIENDKVKAKVLAILLKYAKPDEKDAVNSHIRLGYKVANDPFIKSYYIEAMQYWPDNYKLLSQLAFLNDDVVPASQAMQSFFQLSDIENFIKISDVRNEDSKNDCIGYFGEVFKRAILSGDATLIGYGAKGLRNEEVNFLGASESVDFIDVAINNLDLPRDVETLIDLKKTKAFIQGQEVGNEKPPLNHFVEIDQLKEYAKFHSAKVHTNRGSFIMEFEWIMSPTTVANFIELSNAGFYDSLRFHRVENNFVVQGGCPRGDGWGSSGESIRSEFGPHYYKVGSVGMASAGKDTESCQWFVTHYPSIHLDGSYTNFARVVSGMDVVNELAVGDTVLSVEIN